MRLLIPFLLVILTMSFFWSNPSEFERSVAGKMNGLSFVAPRKPVGDSVFIPITQLNANWVAIIPYAFTRKGSSTVNYSKNSRWWGEGVEGAIATIEMAKRNGLKVMLKPHVWVQGDGWAGDFNPKEEQHWIDWEQSYADYIMTFAKIADSLNVPLLCIGTEYRHAVKERPDFWVKLIKDVKALYGGELTYATNWDNFQHVRFWSDLDYIGIDAYFPLAESKTPDVEELENRWKLVKENIQAFAAAQGRPVLFTEFGYKSIDYSTKGHWAINTDTLHENQMAQANAYRSIFNAFWTEPWFSGGFIWKWHAHHHKLGTSVSKEFSPQHKLAEEVIRAHYKQKSPDQN